MNMLQRLVLFACIMRMTTHAFVVVHQTQTTTNTGKSQVEDNFYSSLRFSTPLSSKSGYTHRPSSSTSRVKASLSSSPTERSRGRSVRLFGVRDRIKRVVQSLSKRRRQSQRIADSLHQQQPMEEFDVTFLPATVTTSSWNTAESYDVNNGQKQVTPSPTYEAEISGVDYEPKRSVAAATILVDPDVAKNEYGSKVNHHHHKVNGGALGASSLNGAATLNGHYQATITTPTTQEQQQEQDKEESICTPNLPDLSAKETLLLKTLYTLPPLEHNPNLTRLEREFRDMLQFFSQFTEADLYTIRDPRIRTIFEGVIASSNEPAVYRAFEILFEDMLPLRIAGRLIFSKLQQIMVAANSRGQTEIDAIVATTGLPTERVQVSRWAFLTLAVATENRHDEEAHLTLEQLVDSGLAETAMTLLGYDSLDDFLATIDQDQRGKVSFAELMIGLQMVAEEACALDRCDPSIVLQSVVTQMEPTLLSNNNIKLDKRRQEYSDRYDEMVGAFQEWDDVVPKGEGRRLDVLRGCFVGAANKRVVEALRVVYMDYAALRVAGNSIFALMRALVTQLRKRNNNNNNGTK